ncbi:hypothetical protein ACP4OV_022880 [Aristida adscensionis]
MVEQHAEEGREEDGGGNHGGGGSLAAVVAGRRRATPDPGPPGAEASFASPRPEKSVSAGSWGGRGRQSTGAELQCRRSDDETPELSQCGFHPV